jgi:hypothetical protein
LLVVLRCPSRDTLFPSSASANYGTNKEKSQPTITMEDSTTIYCKDWAQDSPWSSAMAGPSAPMCGKTRCCFWHPADTAALLTTVAVALLESCKVVFVKLGNDELRLGRYLADIIIDGHSGRVSRAMGRAPESRYRNKRERHLAFEGGTS